MLCKIGFGETPQTEMVILSSMTIWEFVDCAKMTGFLENEGMTHLSCLYFTHIFGNYLEKCFNFESFYNLRPVSLQNGGSS